MHRYTRLLLTALSAAAVLAVAIGSASARSLSVSNQNIRVVWASLELGNTLNANRVRCAVTLEGSLHARTIVKRARSLIGYITRADLNACTGGGATINGETLPWHVTYESFAGTLPTITSVSILLVGATFEILQEGIRCRARTEAINNAAGIMSLGAGGVVTGLRADETRRIPLTQPGGGGGLCSFGSGNFIGTASVALLGTTNSISVTLI